MLSEDAAKLLGGLDGRQVFAMVLANAERLVGIQDAYLRAPCCSIDREREPDLRWVLDRGWDRSQGVPVMAGVGHEPDDLWGPIAAFHIKAHIYDVVEYVRGDRRLDLIYRSGLELVEAIGEFYDDGYLTCDAAGWVGPVDFERDAIAHDLDFLSAGGDSFALREYCRRQSPQYTLTSE